MSKRLSTADRVCCPECGCGIAMTTAAVLQARRRGVLCDCPSCGSEWMHISQQSERYGPHRIDSPHLTGSRPQLKLAPVVPIESTVFIVEADPATRSQLGYLMASVGLKIQTYYTAEEFIAVDRCHKPGCLLFDIDLPGMSGFELHQRLVHMRSSLPLIVLTAIAYATTGVLALKQDAVAFFEKPGNPTAILGAVRKAIAHDTAARQRGLMRTPR